MSNYIAVREGDTVKEYKIPAFGEFTVEQWRMLFRPDAEADTDSAWFHEVKRFSGVPLKALRKMPISEFDRLLEAYKTLRMEASARQAEVSQDFTNPEFIEHEGVKYIVPKDLERESAAQWIDLNAALDKADTEPEVMANICGCMLVPEGQEYAGPLTEKMHTLPVRTAMGLTAFFLSRSERLRTSIARSTKRRVMSLLQGQGLADRSSTKPTAIAGTR